MKQLTEDALTKNYKIGEYYKYPSSNKKFKLVRTNGFVFHFECGHWCTDNVFLDLICMAPGKQLKLFD